MTENNFEKCGLNSTHAIKTKSNIDILPLL